MNRPKGDSLSVGQPAGRGEAEAKDHRDVCARMTVREIQGFLADQYRVEVGADFISTVTDSVLEEVQEWQNRALERMYPVVFFDALRVKIRDGSSRRSTARKTRRRPPGGWRSLRRARGGKSSR